jgi:hypothetical protein
MDDPLESIRILDLTNEKGLLCGRILADLGADVIKIEKPGGDESRCIGPFYHDIPDPEKNLNWFAYNLNKRGITLNLETLDGQTIFKQLIKSADVVELQILQAWRWVDTCIFVVTRIAHQSVSAPIKHIFMLQVRRPWQS